MAGDVIEETAGHFLYVGLILRGENEQVVPGIGSGN